MGKTVSGEVKMDRLYKLKCWIYPLSFLGAEMFSAFCGITGYKQEEGSTLYLYYMISLFAFSMQDGFINPNYIYCMLFF